MTDSLLLALGSIAMGDNKDGVSYYHIDMGPDHPSNGGLVWLTAQVDGEKIQALDVLPGALHRGAEMLFEVRDYRQILSLANRHDWQAPVFGELLVASVVERELGIEIPPRAAWLRTFLAEHQRVQSHLAQLSFVSNRLGRGDLATGVVREELRRRTLDLTGNRLHPMATRLGGVAVDPDAGWLDATVATHREAASLAGRIAEALDASGLGRDIAVLNAEDAAGYGLSGVVARASGLDEDLRRDAGGGVPGLAYAELGDALAPPTTPTTGDAHARLCWLAAEVGQSADVVARCASGMPSGELAVRLPKVVKLPEGDSYAEIEAPLGRAGVFVVSRADKTPWRMRLRTPSLANVSAWASAGIGALDDLPVMIASLGYVTGDLDK